MSMENFGNLEFADNAAPRIAVSIVLDLSDSMTIIRPGETRSPLEALNGGLDTLWSALRDDPLARNRAEVSFAPFGSEVSPPTPFTTVDNMVLPELQPLGLTSLGAAMNHAIDSVEERKNEYKTNGVNYYKPIVILITDGVATDDTAEASQRIKALSESKSMTFFPIGVEGADLNALQEIFGKTALKLSGVKFEELFVWISKSVSAVSASQPGDAVATPMPSDWAEL